MEKGAKKLAQKPPYLLGYFELIKGCRGFD